MTANLKKELIKLGSTNPQLQPHLRDLFIVEVMQQVDFGVRNISSRLRPQKITGSKLAKGIMGRIL